MNKSFNYSFHSQLIFRSPAIPFIARGLTEEEFYKFSQNDEFTEAIYLASPTLHTELLKWHAGQLTDKKEIDKLRTSLYKYYIRMQSRCTPYGLFAACSTTSWGAENKLSSGSFKRHTRLDMNFVCALAQHIAKNESINSHLLFFPNNSLYLIGTQLRYVEYKYINNRRIHQISSIENSEYIEKTVSWAKQGSYKKDLAQSLLSDEISMEEAEGFIDELISSQVLVSELEPTVSGEEFEYSLLTSLKKLYKATGLTDTIYYISLLENTLTAIKIIDNNIKNEVSAYKSIYNNLKELDIPIEENQLFQADLFRKSSGSLHTKIQKDIQEGISFLNNFFMKSENKHLKKFGDNFRKQYEDAEMPLLIALDTESGVGYTGKDVSGVNNLLNGLNFWDSQGDQEIKWNMIQKKLLTKIIEAEKHNLNTIIFTDDDLEQDNDRYSDSIPHSLAVMFKMLDNKIYFQSCGGSSAANLLGRFAHGDSDIEKLVQEISAHEQSFYSDKILAEIVHLPESRIGNILLRPVFREYEIPYLAKSALASDKQLDLQDLFISVKNDKIILRSKRFNKEVIPRLSTAHNYSFNALPVYQFLCDLQSQYYEKPVFNFTWGVLSQEFKFLPRAEYKNTILFRARWNLSKKDLEEFKDMADAIVFRKKWNMPRHICLVDGDNELLIDLESEASVEMLLSTIKKREQAVFEEFLFDPDNLLVKDEEGNSYTNEFIAILLQNKKEKKNLSRGIEQNVEMNVMRNFSLGSEWLYYKFYCGIKTADKLLSESIRPLVEELLEAGMIEKFFFIRYADPEQHIRLRFKVKDTQLLGEVIARTNSYTESFTSTGLISKVQTDTYARELERYGANSIDMAESLFFEDSITTLYLLGLIEGEEGEEIRWLFALRSMDELLDNFRYGDVEKMQLLEWMKESYINEHGGSKDLKVQLDGKFRSLRKKAEDILNRERDTQRDIFPLIELLEAKSVRCKDIANALLTLNEKKLLQVDLNNLLSSYLHMMLNRIFNSRQRTYEMMLYDILYRIYTSKVAREKKQKKEVNI